MYALLKLAIWVIVEGGWDDYLSSNQIQSLKIPHLRLRMIKFRRKKVIDRHNKNTLKSTSNFDSLPLIVFCQDFFESDVVRYSLANNP